MDTNFTEGVQLLQENSSLENLVKAIDLLHISKYQPLASIYKVFGLAYISKIKLDMDLLLNAREQFIQVFNWKDNLDTSNLISEELNISLISEYISVLSHIALVDGYKNLQMEIELMYEALNKDPQNGMLNYNLGHLYRKAGQVTKSAVHLQMAIQIDPKWVDSYLELGLIFCDQKKYLIAEKIFLKGLEQKPYDKLYNELGVIYSLNNKKEKAIKSFDKAMSLNPDNDLKSTICINRGYISSSIGRIEESLEHYKQAMKLNPNNILSFQNYLLNINYTFKPSKEIYETHLEYAGAITKAVKKYDFTPVLANKTVSQKEIIRIGYVSGDFWNHAVTFFSKPLIKDFDQSKFQIFCYSSGEINQQEIKNYPQNVTWKSIKHLDTYNTAKIIEEDHLHILVDLAGHTSNNRLDVFVYRLAPIQLSYLGYPNTTGMDLMDYRLVDYNTDFQNDKYNSEKLIKLECFICFTPPIQTPPPVKTSDKIVFGSFNKFNKLNDKVIKAWDDILTKVTESEKEVQLVLKGSFYDDYNDEIKNKFSYKNRSKILILKKTATYNEHIELYKLIDISLDTFPYCGTTTTCESLWSGVPVVTLFPTEKHVSRVSGSILKNCGLDEFIAVTEEHYVATALKMVMDREHLKEVKTNLHKKFSNSLVMNSKKFMLGYENLMVSLLKK